MMNETTELTEPNKIDFSVLLRAPQYRSFEEQVLFEKIIADHRDEALTWLRLNNACIDSLFDKTERFVESRYFASPAGEQAKAALLLVAHTLQSLV